MHFDWKSTRPFEDLRHLKVQLIFHYWNGPCWVLTTFFFDGWSWLICMIVGFPCFCGQWVEQRSSLEYQHRVAWKYTFYEPNVSLVTLFPSLWRPAFWAAVDRNFPISFFPRGDLMYQTWSWELLFYLTAKENGDSGWFISTGLWLLNVL